jgi:uncharacterized protein YqjF (DUF2071 family)
MNRGVSPTWPPKRPPGRPAGFQRWRHLLFLHWPVESAIVQAQLPAELEVETFDGTAFVGVVPFTMKDVSPWWSPSVPGISNFHELNVRTYVRRAGVSGVWFFSLDAASSLAVMLARSGWHLPYHRARMSLEVEADRVRYHSTRRWPKPVPADLDVDYRIGEARGHAQPGSIEHFFLERYLLFARDKKGTLRVGRVHHEPYPFCDVALGDLRQSMTLANELGACSDAPPFAHYSPGVDVDVYRLVPA